jgi:hypothetical protein
MRRIRRASGVSLRQVEAGGAWRRGTLSQIETAKSRPSHAIVQWYDDTFAADGLLLSLFAEAHAVQPFLGPVPGTDREVVVAGDRFALEASSLPAGTLVEAGVARSVVWQLTNSGTVAWRGRQLRRVGASAGVRLVASAATCAVPEAAPGATVRVECSFTPPQLPGTVVAYWRMTHSDGSFCFPMDAALSVLLVVR